MMNLCFGIWLVFVKVLGKFFLIFVMHNYAKNMFCIIMQTRKVSHYLLGDFSSKKPNFGSL